jgi:hypothetical protein
MIALFSVLLFASDTAATTVQPEPTAPAAAEGTRPIAKEERKICKREANTGSNMPSKRVCLTAKQWREREQQESW